MKTILGWPIKLSVAGLVYVGITSGTQIKLPEEVLGYKVPPSAQQWIDRNAQIGDFGKQTQAGFKILSGNLK